MSICFCKRDAFKRRQADGFGLHVTCVRQVDESASPEQHKPMREQSEPPHMGSKIICHFQGTKKISCPFCDQSGKFDNCPWNVGPTIPIRAQDKHCVKSQDLRNFPSGSIGGEGGPGTLLCLFVFSHGLSVVYPGPRVQLIPTGFWFGVSGNACHKLQERARQRPPCMSV